MGTLWEPLEGVLDASWEALGHQNGVPNRLREPSWHVFDIVSPSFDLKVSPRERLGPSRAPLGSLLDASWASLGPSWEALGSILEPSWSTFSASKALGKHLAHKFAQK